jgi:hypothetical protein
LTTGTTLFQSPQWSKDQLFLYDVSIQIYRSDICVAYTERTGKRLDLLVSYPSDMDYIGQSAILPLHARLDEVLSIAEGAHRFYVLVESPVHSMVPDVFFDKAHADELLYAANNPVENHEVLFNKIPSQQAVMLFSFNKYILSLLQSKLKSPVMVHHTTALLQYLHIQHQDGLYLFSGPDFITLIRIRNGKTEFINSFDAGTENDALYFILAAFEEFNIQSDEQLTVFMANDQHSILFPLLQKYIPNVLLADTSTLHVAGHHLPLLMASQCE